MQSSRVFIVILNLVNISLGDGVSEVGNKLIDDFGHFVGILSVIFHVALRVACVSIVVAAVAVVKPAATATLQENNSNA
jgi:hypothetical protein